MPPKIPQKARKAEVRQSSGIYLRGDLYKGYVKSTFRFNAQTVFLTYSQTPAKLTPEMVLTKIKQKAEVEDYLISQERHEDGGYHIHAYIKFAQKLDTKNPRFFDVKYYKMYHPNVQRVKSKYSLWRYIKKDGSYIDSGFESRPSWQIILHESTTDMGFFMDIMFKVGRIDNYAGYRTLLKLWELKQTDARKNKVVRWPKPARKT